MPHYFVQWTSRALGAAAERQVSEDDAERVVRFPADVVRSRSSGRRVAVGRSASGEGVFVVYEHLDPDTVLIITVFVED